MANLFEAEAPVGFARVAVDRGIDRYPEGLTYAIPATLAAIGPGDRVVVPLGRGDARTHGYVIELSADRGTAPGDPKFIVGREDGPPLPGGLLALARWVSSYYCAPIGVTLDAMLPSAVKRKIGAVMRTMVDLEAPAPPEAKLPPKQRAVIEVLAGLAPTERPVEIRSLAERAGLGTTGPVKRLLERGLLTAVHKTTVEAAWMAPTVDASAPERLTDDQRGILESIETRLAAGFSAHLLFGVTGSGKTEVYIRLIERVIARGRTALVLVPEIALTPQTGGRLLGRFPRERVAVLHSGLSAAQRHQQWALVADGTASIVLGARSAVFAPIPDDRLGLIVIDEEHDGSYKQDQAPRYHGRDVAIRRAQLAACPIVLGSATPSFESWHNATERGVYALHRLEQRVPGMRTPVVKVLDFAAERRARTDRRIHLLGPTLERALGRVLAERGQALLLLNRRGYANYIACPDAHCGWVMQCDDCDVTMVYHRTGGGALPGSGFVRCHHCRSEQRLPASCPVCDRRVTTFGLGTQRVEEELARKFPALETGRTMMRVDSDTMRSARDFHDVLGRFGAGELQLLIGTQMIAKGLDFPGVRLVGVINADTAINLPDFRASERTFALVSQVAGRCGRSTDPAAPGLVIVQSFNPELPAIRLAAAHDYPSFARQELDERRRCGLPPFTRLVRIIVRDADAAAGRARAEALAAGLRAVAAAAIEVRGPAPCPIARIAGRHRYEIEMTGPGAADLQRLLAEARNRRILEPGAAVAVDVDPLVLV